MTELEKSYNASEVEEKIYQAWLDSGFFNPDNLPDAQKREPFTIIMPPPNVTGTLHAGHALFVTIQDIFTRYARMQNKRTLWLPGTDHAAIATQAKVEKLLYDKEKQSRYDLGREEFLKRVEEYAKKSQDTILTQIKKMGASCDWSRLAYTLDEPREKAVRTAFKQMYEEGLIYRGKRIVNWDPKMQTTVSDDEIEWKEETVPFYYLKYGPFTIATARPETKFGDKYVVMHPDDKRYEAYRDGQQIELEWINGPIVATVVKDYAIDMAFGTGVMTITPWHDLADFEIAQRHNLDMEQIIDDKGLLLPMAGEFAGEHIKKARSKIVEKLQSKGLIEKVDEHYTHRIATNSRGGGTIEPQIKEQWFIDVNKKFKAKTNKLLGIKQGQEISLKEAMRQVVESGQIKIVPDHFAKIYFHWIDNLRDWCISRQIWYGHRIPVWYKNDETYVGIDEPAGKWEQDPDTLDTWFSSGLWTFSTLGWPEETTDLKAFHPTQILETAYEILFFWVARMILMSTYLIGDIPFETVYLHGLVRDEKREKLSKSKGDSADPLDLIAKFGTDALRMALVFNTSPGMDSILSEEKIKGMKHFGNKLWNVARYVMQNVAEGEIGFKEGDEFSAEEDAVLGELGVARKEKISSVINFPQRQEMRLIKTATVHLENFRLHEAAQEIYGSLWHGFADKYIEYSKDRLQNGSEDEKRITKTILFKSLRAYLKLLHPFMPFITEHIWQLLRERKLVTTELLMITEWPQDYK